MIRKILTLLGLATAGAVCGLSAAIVIFVLWGILFT